MASRSSSDPFVLLSWGIFRADVGPPEGAFIWGPLGALLELIFGKSRLRRPGKGPEAPPKGPAKDPGAEQKVLQEGSWMLLANLKTKC